MSSALSSAPGSCPEPRPKRRCSPRHSPMPPPPAPCRPGSTPWGRRRCHRHHCDSCDRPPTASATDLPAGRACCIRRRRERTRARQVEPRRHAKAGGRIPCRDVASGMPLWCGQRHGPCRLDSLSLLLATRAAERAVRTRVGGDLRPDTHSACARRADPNLQWPRLNRPPRRKRFPRQRRRVQHPSTSIPPTATKEPI